VRRSGSSRLLAGVALALTVRLCAAADSLPAADGAPAAGPVEAGRYLFRAAGCAACHTDADAGGAFLAGGRAFETPFGTFYSPNITPHAQHGIGAWSAEQFVAAVTRGVGPGSIHYYPVFPYPSYARMRREDVLAIWAYLGTVEADDTRNRAHDIPWYLLRVSNWFWKLLYLDRDVPAARTDRSEAWNRGAYLVDALAHCAECHSPRNVLGAIQQGLRFAGTADGLDGPVPNITSDEDTGIGTWTVGEVAEYLSSGFDPDFDAAGDAMAEVIEEGTSHLSDADRAAIAEYITSLAPIRHEVSGE
jgi:mono/diheme cytochrome c family protein